MKKIAIFLSILLFMGNMVANAQTRTISGTVASAEDEMPIPGVSVSVKGTTLGTVTNIDGEYELRVPEDAQTLIFSFVGMKSTEVLLTSATTYNVEMESESLGIDEVVVTALGTSRSKKSLGYASQGVGSEDITAANSVNPLSALSGRVAGMQVAGSNFSGSKNILIRGASSFSQNNQPLFVVDGVPISNENFNTTSTQNGGGGYDYGSMTNDLNSYDIENVEVLKGSAASALYGSRGQNGVIMITTKSGKAGKKAFQVEINSGVNFENVSILPKQQKLYGGGYGDFDTETINGVEYQVPGYAVDESWGPRYEGQQVLHWWGAADYEQGITDTPVTGAWEYPKKDVSDFYETGISFQNSVNLVTTSETSALRIGYTNVDMTGTTPNASQQKHNFNINGSSSLFNDIIEVTANVNVVQTDTKGRPQGGYGDNSQSQKFFQWGQRQLDFSKLKNYINPDGTQRVWNRGSVTDPAPVYSDNPYWTAYKNYQDDDRTRIFGKGGIKANLTDYLSASANFYYDTYTFNQRERVAKGSQALSWYKQINRQATETNLEGKLEFNKTYEDFSVLAMIGGNTRKNDYARFEGETNGGLVVDQLYNLNNSVNAPLLDDLKREIKVNSWFASASVGYKNMIYLDGTFRKDYDSTLPTGINSYSYSSVSSSFIASELIEVAWLDNLKVRANYGETGNGTSAYQVFNTYVIGNPFNGNPVFTNDDRLKNQELKPELTSEIEFGLEGAFLKSRVGFDFSYYNRDTKNQIVPVEVSGSSGYTERVINAGKINNKGIEILVYGTPVKTKDFTWDVTFNFAKNVNEVKELPEGLDKIQLARAPFGGAYINAVEGATFQEIYAYDYVYENGKKVVGEDGMYITSGELTSVGSVLPDWTGGIRNSFRYKSFDVSALIDISKGGKYYSLTNMWGMYSGMAEGTATPTSNGNTIREDGIVLDGVTEDGAENTTVLGAIDWGELHYHGYGTPSATSIFKSDYIKLREVTFGYTFPKFVDFIEGLRLSVYGRNLAVWGLDNKGIDPETIVNGSGNIQGLEGGIIPATSSYGFNLKINF
ncbi:SusC/RagA family TonB-linked outer membrane protein [Prolixibacteraceae bacterium Z1-6]|uniref:SusC/RagA family TonB-linked outer membrane protein n=1 Tax=Draconibacterium aestuarii TaxID=2998507 RepID=A0A9X3J6G9_9BACT|nr:SusC/RagA family TonB-linked outer membrane protein [Prolixibacteraceae bacterium Z1-6]